MDEKSLTALGFSENELPLFRAVLKAGEVPATALAKVAGVKRTTAYSIARSLAEKGFLVEDATRRPRVFRPASTESVLGLIESEKKDVAKKELLYRTFANELSKISASRSYPVPTVRFIEEERIDSFMRQQSPVWDENMLEKGEPTWWGFQDHTIVEEFGGWIEWYWKQRPPQIDLKLLSNRSESEVKFGKKITPSRQIKFWGEATNFLSTTWAIGDYLVMVNTRTHPFYLVEIHDALMAHDQREVFRNLWPLVP